MKIIRNIKGFIDEPRKYLVLVLAKYFNWLPDREYISIMFWLKHHYWPNLKNPKSFNEKLQWLKLYDRNPAYTTMVDKYEAKKYVADIIGEGYIIPTLAVYNRAEDINFDELPDRFVLKCTHDSGSVVVCKCKDCFDKAGAVKKLNLQLCYNHSGDSREWPYKNVIPRIIAEQYMEDEQTQELRDYKFFCFDGVVKALFIASERMKEGEETKFDFFDENYNHLPFTNGHPNAEALPQKPVCFNEMKELAAKLSKGIPHVRVDFYEVNKKVYFGELTFYHWSGMKPFEPREWDYKFGEWIKLPSKKV